MRRGLVLGHRDDVTLGHESRGEDMALGCRMGSHLFVRIARGERNGATTRGSGTPPVRSAREAP